MEDMKEFRLIIHTLDERPNKSCEVYVMLKYSTHIMTITYSKKHDAFNVLDSDTKEEVKETRFTNDNILWWAYVEQVNHIEKPILTDEERDYLKERIKPFRKLIKYIYKINYGNNSYYIYMDMGKDMFGFFTNEKLDRAYDGLEENVKYTLEELGL